MKAESIYEKFAAAGFSTEKAHVVPQVCDAVAKALELALLAGPAPLIYLGGSTYVVSEAIQSWSLDC